MVGEGRIDCLTANEMNREQSRVWYCLVGLLRVLNRASMGGTMETMGDGRKH